MKVFTNKARIVAAGLTAGLLLPALALAGPWGVLKTQDGKQSYELKKDRVVVGTSKRADVRLQHPTVASKHIELSHKAGIVKVTDLGSRTGTLVAGTELKKGRSMQLFQRTIISLGALNLGFEWGDRGKLIKPLRKSKSAEEAGAASKPSKAKKRGKSAKKRVKKPTQ